jgi:hypothetical protein
MWQDRKRLVLLVAMVPVLAAVYVLLHGLPGSRAGQGPGDPPGLAPVPAARIGTARPLPPAGPGKFADESRRIAQIALRPTPRDVPVLKAAVAHPSPEVALQAVRGLGRVGLQGDPATLVAVLADRNASVEQRCEAAEYLGEMRYWEAGSTLIDVLEDPSAALRARANVALRKIMIVSFDYHADGPSDRRHQAVQLLRQWWPKAYEKHLALQGR